MLLEFAQLWIADQMKRKNCEIKRRNSGEQWPRHPKMSKNEIYMPGVEPAAKN